MYRYVIDFNVFMVMFCGEENVPRVRKAVYQVELGIAQ